MGTYAKAGLAQGLSSGLMGMGSMLLDVQARSEQRAFREYQMKQDAADRKDRQDQFEYKKWADKENYRRAGLASERAEQVRRAEAMTRAQERAAGMQAEGITAIVNPPALDIVGDPTDPNAQLRSTMTLPEVPRITMGGYDPARDPTMGRARAFTGMGYGPGGQMPTREPNPPQPRAGTVVEIKKPDGVHSVLVNTATGEEIRDLGLAPPKSGLDLGGLGGGAGLGLSGGGTPDPAAAEGPGFFRRMGNRLGITESEAPAPTTSTPARAFAGDPPAFAGPQMSAAQGAGAEPSSLQQDIEAALADGDTPETILSDMEAAGVPQEMMTKAAEILRNRAR